MSIMSMKNKNNKLSLKSKGKKTQPAKTPNTILSMFKRQHDKQIQAKEQIGISDCEEEGDVMITKVIKSESGTILGGTVDDLQQKHHEGHKQVKEQKVSKLRKRKSSSKLENSAESNINRDEKCAETEGRFVKKSKVYKNEIERIKASSLAAGDDVTKPLNDLSTRDQGKASGTEKDVDIVSIESNNRTSKRRRLSLRSRSSIVDTGKAQAGNNDNGETENCVQADKNSNKKELSLLSDSNISTMKQIGNQLNEPQSTASNKTEPSPDMPSGVESKNVFKTMFEKQKTENLKKGQNERSASNKDEVQKDTAEDEGDSGDEDDATVVDETAGSYRVPYYLENFKTILDTVMSFKENVQLFDDTDQEAVVNFNQLSEPCQKLYIRIFSRKLSWLPTSVLRYPEIGDNIPELVNQLIQAGFLHSGDNLTDLSIVLKTLQAPDLKTLGKSFHVNVTGQTKKNLIELLIKKSQQSCISSMFTGGRGISTEKTMIDRAKSYIGTVCRLKDSPRAVFIRVLMLFSLYHTNLDDDGSGGGQNQLFQMLMANIGRVVYPKYTVNRQRTIFKDRAALLRFETALQWEMDMQGKMETSKWNEAYDIYLQASAVGKQILDNKEYRKWDAALPEFLRLYTAGSVYVRIDSRGVEVFQRKKLYKEAVELLEHLLAQPLYCPHCRGHWYKRLALNLDAHLKAYSKCLDVIKRGMADAAVRSGSRLDIYERAKKICTAPKSKYADRMSEFGSDLVEPTPETSVEGKVISDATQMGMKYQFIMEGDTEGVTLCAVEEFVLEHYKYHGYPDGVHAEGSIVSNLFVLFFWDIMFMDVEDVFQGPFQSSPLDMHTPDFYCNRKHHVDERLQWIRSAPLQDLVTEVGRVWEDHSGTMCGGINWDNYNGPNKHQGLVQCMGGEIIAGILERYVKDPRHTRGGFPDLTLWNTEDRNFKICEVKGPGDRLSYKQILWIDYLVKMGVDAEVCYVKAVASKRLKPSTSKT